MEHDVVLYLMTQLIYWWISPMVWVIWGVWQIKRMIFDK